MKAQKTNHCILTDQVGLLYVHVVDCAICSPLLRHRAVTVDPQFHERICIEFPYEEHNLSNTPITNGRVIGILHVITNGY